MKLLASIVAVGVLLAAAGGAPAAAQGACLTAPESTASAGAPAAPTDLRHSTVPVKTQYVSYGVSIDLAWVDNSTDEACFVIERALSSAPQDFRVHAIVPANTTTYRDYGPYRAGAHSFVGYRVYAATAVARSGYSNTAIQMFPADETGVPGIDPRTLPHVSGGHVPPPDGGFGLFVVTRARTTDLVRLSGCPEATAAFWVIDREGNFVTYVPGSTVAEVNAAWHRLFPGGGLPDQTPVIGKCF